MLIIEVHATSVRGSLVYLLKNISREAKMRSIL